jgi:integrase
MLARNKCYEIEYIIENNNSPTDDDLCIKRVTPENSKKALFNLQETFNHFLMTKEFSQKSRSMYKNAFNKFSEVIKTDIEVNSISEFHYDVFKKHLIEKMSYATSQTYINYMKIFIDSCIKNGSYKKENPFIRLKSREKKYITIIPETHFTLILDYLKEHNLELYRFIYFLKLTGFRLNEGLLLNWEQIKFDENIISMTTFKDNNRNDVFPLNIENGTLKKFLLSFRNESGKIFNLNPEWVRVPFQKAIESVNKLQIEADSNFSSIPKYTIHDIRRTFCSKFANKLTPIELMKLTRHKDINTTLKYYVNIDVKSIADKLNDM